MINFSARENSHRAANVVLVSGQDQLLSSSDAVSAKPMLPNVRSEIYSYSGVKKLSRVALGAVSIEDDNRSQQNDFSPA
jgi:hypothetical protein